MIQQASLAVGSDVFAWSSLWDISEKDENDNVHKGDVLSSATQNNYVLAETGFVVMVGLHDVLVAAKDQVQDVKYIT